MSRHHEETPTSPSRDVDEFVEEFGAAIDDSEAPLQYFGSPDIFEAEMERIFSKEWILIGHESEIPDRGDYALRYIGPNPFIFTRSEADNVNVLFNSCRHKGTEVCRAEQGNTTHFRCPYHGWTYNNEGELTGVPQRQAFPEDLEEESLGLVSAPRVDSYEGLVFASLSDDGDSLAEFLGDYTYYLDISLKLSDAGMEVVGVPYRYEIPTNWKTRVENGYGDSYHVGFTHRSVIETIMDYDDDDKYWRRGNVGKHGFGLSVQNPDSDIYLGHSTDVISPEANLDQNQVEILRRSNIQTGAVFPNLTFIHTISSTSSETEATGTLLVRKWRPLGPNKTEVWVWILAPKDAPDDYKERVYDAGKAWYRNFEPDDKAVVATASRAGGTPFARKQGINMNYQLGEGLEGDTIDDGIDDEEMPGNVINRKMDDFAIRKFHAGWYDSMKNHK